MTKQTAPVRSCRTHVEGGVLAFPCGLPEDHDGPHSAIENPASMRRRATWEAEHAAHPAAPPSVAPVLPADPADRVNVEAIGRTASLPILAALRDEDARLSAFRTMLDREVETLPHPVQDWAFSMLAFTSLGALWTLAISEFEKGAVAVTITPEALDRLVPQRLRQRLGLTTTRTTDL